MDQNETLRVMLDKASSALSGMQITVAECREHIAALMLRNQDLERENQTLKGAKS